MTERTARLESQHDQLREDLHRIERRQDERFAKVDAQFDKVDARFEKMEARFEKVDARFEKLESALAALKDSFAEFRLEMKGALAALEKSRIADRVWQLLINAAMLGVMARGFKWI